MGTVQVCWPFTTFGDSSGDGIYIEQTKHIPVILFSAHVRGDGTHGADAFLAKPFHIKGLVETVQRYV